MMMEKIDVKDVWAVILAAGRGSRMNSTDTNKVALPLAGRPIICHTISNLQKAGITHIVVVVGFAKESVLKCLDENIVTAEQTEQLGTGHAVKVAIEKIPFAQDVFVLNGDDSYVFTPEILTNLFQKHKAAQASVSFLTLMTDTPSGLGRIVRDSSGKVVGIVEEKDATEVQKGISEINPACYLFSYDFLKKNLDSIEKSSVTGEFYVTRLIDIAVKNGVAIATHTEKGLQWRGINTPAELEEANKMYAPKVL
jgi:bifunctional N-acetylglucosamine-1-phosphate-uridyltransferase/glucosamine-1-phosphate-acetyltransferase GlmU-like protein